MRDFVIIVMIILFQKRIYSRFIDRTTIFLREIPRDIYIIKNTKSCQFFMGFSIFWEKSSRPACKREGKVTKGQKLKGPRGLLGKRDARKMHRLFLCSPRRFYSREKETASLPESFTQLSLYHNLRLSFSLSLSLFVLSRRSLPPSLPFLPPRYYINRVSLLSLSLRLYPTSFFPSREFCVLSDLSCIFSSGNNVQQPPMHHETRSICRDAILDQEISFKLISVSRVASPTILRPCSFFFGRF